MLLLDRNRGRGYVNKLLSLLREPIWAEKRALLEARWRELPAELQVDWQVVGRHHVHCGYTLGPSYCSFGCTHCYLPANANRVPLHSLAEMQAQIDANRRLIGPGGGLQITGGDVVDAYWRAGRADELVAIVRYANDAGVVPMLMTHGQLLLEHPDYLERLVRRGGLRKLAIHIDITQAGRRDYPISRLESEVDLHPLREKFVDLILDVQRRTGVRFHAAHTVTVTERNRGSVEEILRWLISDPRRLDAFRMISLQPEADVGRTRSSPNPMTPEQTWRKICSAVGLELDRDNLMFGHPDCSHFTTLLMLYPPRRRRAEAPSRRAQPRVVNLIAADVASRAFWPALLETFSGLGSRGESDFEANVRILALIARCPTILWRTARYALALARREGLSLSRLVRILVTGRFRALGVVQHNFMNAEEISAPRSEAVEKRLAACSLRGAVRREGTWTAVPMCAMNGEEREALYANRTVEGPDVTRSREGAKLSSTGETTPASRRRRRNLCGR